MLIICRRRICPPFLRVKQHRSQLLLLTILCLILIFVHFLKNYSRSQKMGVESGIRDYKIRRLREIQAIGSLRNKMKLNIWEQIMGQENEKLLRLSGTRNVSDAMMRQLENRGQDYYMKLLERRGQLMKYPEGGGGWIKSVPAAPVKLPSGLKNRNLNDLTEKEKIWLNVTHFPWTNDTSCEHFSVQFDTRRSLPVIGLVSYPSSGNTWIRYLIEGLTGYFTGSMYNDYYISKKGFCGEVLPYDSGMSVAIKSHGHTTGIGSYENTSRYEQINLYDHLKELNHTAIVLIRNPFKAIIGHRHLDEGGHTGLAPEDKFVGEGWEYFVDRKIAHWQNLYLDWLKFGNTIKVVHYENLKHGLEESLRKIVEFLGQPLNENRLKCVVDNSVGQFVRSKKRRVESVFDLRQKSKIFSAIEKVNEALAEAGQEPIPVEKYELHNL